MGNRGQVGISFMNLLSGAHVYEKECKICKCPRFNCKEIRGKKS
jgi:uncharacterized Zn finger protein (UPF0148 family)